LNPLPGIQIQIKLCADLKTGLLSATGFAGSDQAEAATELGELFSRRSRPEIFNHVPFEPCSRPMVQNHGPGIKKRALGQACTRCTR
jgi:hypothetical protein